MSEKDAQTPLRKIGDSQPAVTIPGVRLGVQLGFGGMATVYEGWDDGFNPPRRVAIKLMNPELSADPAFRTRFEREASLVADFRHDNIVHVYASGEAGGIKYIVMEYLGGGTLAEKLLQGKLPPAEALKHAAVLAGALAYSHTRDIVHRDVKPANVLFTADGKPILSDFGVAKASSSSLSSALTQQASVVGAPRYMAPEQELGDHVSDRADVYSLGLTLYEMLTGEPPSAAVRLQRIVDETNHFAELLPSLPAEVTELLHRCLQVDPAARPSAAEFSRHLHAAAARLGGGRATDAPAVRRAQRVRMIGIIAGIVALAGVAVLGARGPEPKPAVPPPVAQPSRVAVDIQKIPASAQLYLDGKQLLQDRYELEPGAHRLLAVAPGYYGQIHTVQVAAPATTLTVELQPTTLPSTAQYELFLTLADAPSLTVDQRDSVGEQTLKLALHTKLLRQTQDLNAVQAMEDELRSLADAGDARALVVLLLDPAIQAGRIAPTAMDERLLAAAESGDAMASFFAALVLRSQLQSAAVGAELQAYCARMQQAANQGWPQVAGDYLQRDGCR